MDQSRTELLIGPAGREKLHNAKVAVFGLGGVGGYTLEALVRAGVGSLFIADYDVVVPSNINRQLLALVPEMDRLKTDVARDRLHKINPGIQVEVCSERLMPDNIEKLLSWEYDYAVDAIDEVPSKVALIEALYVHKKIFITSMGAGSRMDPLKMQIADISKTQYCPLARSVRQRLKNNGISKGVQCVYSTEVMELTDKNRKRDPESGKLPQGTISYMPAVFGLAAASYIIRKIVES